MKYAVIITETLTTTVTVDAENKKEALDIVKKKYDDCEIVLSSEDFFEVDMNVMEYDNPIGHYDLF